MFTTKITLLIILVSLTSALLGYYFCKMRYRVKDLMAMLKILTGVMDGSLSHQEALKLYREIKI